MDNFGEDEEDEYDDKDEKDDDIEESEDLESDEDADDVINEEEEKNEENIDDDLNGPSVTSQWTKVSKNISGIYEIHISGGTEGGLKVMSAKSDGQIEL